MSPKLALALVPLAAVVAPLDGSSFTGQTQDASSAPLQVAYDKDNVVASALIGDWVPDPELWKRIQGEEIRFPPGIEAPTVTFARDDSIAARLPQAVHGTLQEGGLYLTGTIKNLFSEEPVPFALTTFHGNPHVVWFQERDGDPMGDAESFNVSLVVAKEPSEDLLFIGVDFQTRTEAFEPFRRADK